MNNFLGSGGTIEYANSTGSAVAGGTVVVIGAMLAVTVGDILDGESGPAKTTGVFTLPKVSAAVIGQGETLTWDVSAKAFDDNAAIAAAGDITGAAAVAFVAAGNGDTTLQVLLTGTPGTVN